MKIGNIWWVNGISSSASFSKDFNLLSTSSKTGKSPFFQHPFQSFLSSITLLLPTSSKTDKSSKTGNYWQLVVRELFTSVGKCNSAFERSSDFLPQFLSILCDICKNRSENNILQLIPFYELIKISKCFLFSWVLTQEWFLWITMCAINMNKLGFKQMILIYINTDKLFSMIPFFFT